MALASFNGERKKESPTSGFTPSGIDFFDSLAKNLKRGR
jgi:hypothetical protein